MLAAVFKIALRAASLRLATAAALWLVLTVHASPPGPGYELLYADEFNGGHLDESSWEYRVGRRTGGNVNATNVAEAVGVSGGLLHIKTWERPTSAGVEHLGGGVMSRHQFGYGYYETRSRPFMKGRGVHSAFWQAGGAVPNNDVFEIDSYEIDSTSPMGCNNLYLHLGTRQNSVPWPHRANLRWTPAADGWFYDSFDYSPAGVTFYDNGRVVAKAEWPDLVAQQRIWLTALNGVGAVDAQAQPGETTFDYFRYYGKDYPGANLLPNGSFEYNQDRIPAGQPVCWRQDGDAGASEVVAGDAYRDHYKLVQGDREKPFHAVTTQRLEFLMNGTYELTAMVRTRGALRRAGVGVSDFGGGELFVAAPAGASTWTQITIPAIAVTNHRLGLAIEAAGEAGAALEVDDVRLFKPLPGGRQPLPYPGFALPEPLSWTLALNEPIAFAGDGKFYFFDRTVGVGDAITVALVLRPERLAQMCPIAKRSKVGDRGWAIVLDQEGNVRFQIGSEARHEEVVAPSAYTAGVPVQITCIFDHGTASVLVNNAVRAVRRGLSCSVDDASAPGRLGTVDSHYDVVGDVIAPSGSAAVGGQWQPYRGEISQVRVENESELTPPGVIAPTKLWLDSMGRHIQAHGGGIIQWEGAYYWFGEDRSAENDPAKRYVAGYRSTNLTDWVPLGQVFVASDPEKLGPKWVLERPKVFPDPAHHRFVMYMHVDGPVAGETGDYRFARVGVAVASRIEGPYQYVRSFRPLGRESRDIGQFIDDDGAAYLIFEDRPNGFVIARLSSDRLSVEQAVCALPEHFEGGAIAHVGSTYYCIGSQLSGWRANPNQYATAPSLAGPWSPFRDLAPPFTATYGAQSSMLVAVKGSAETQLLFVGDVWRPKAQWDSRYLWMPLEITATTLRLPPPTIWRLEPTTGHITLPPANPPGGPGVP